MRLRQTILSYRGCRILSALLLINSIGVHGRFMRETVLFSCPFLSTAFSIFCCLAKSLRLLHLNHHTHHRLGLVRTSLDELSRRTETSRIQRARERHQCWSPQETPDIQLQRETCTCQGPVSLCYRRGDSCVHESPLQATRLFSQGTCRGFPTGKQIPPRLQTYKDGIQGGPP